MYHIFNIKLYSSLEIKNEYLFWLKLNIILHLALRNLQITCFILLFANCTFSYQIFISSSQPRYSLLLKQIFAYNLEGRSNPSGEVKYTTCPDKPGSPKTPYIKGKIYAHRVKIGWGNVFIFKMYPFCLNINYWEEIFL